MFGFQCRLHCCSCFVRQAAVVVCRQPGAIDFGKCIDEKGTLLLPSAPKFVAQTDPLSGFPLKTAGASNTLEGRHLAWPVRHLRHRLLAFVCTFLTLATLLRPSHFSCCDDHRRHPASELPATQGITGPHRAHFSLPLALTSDSTGATSAPSFVAPHRALQLKSPFESRRPFSAVAGGLHRTHLPSSPISLVSSDTPACFAAHPPEPPPPMQ